MGSDISQSAEDRWLMDLLRAHADAIILGVNTLVEEAQAAPDRGPVYTMEEPALYDLRRKLGRGRETNTFVTGAARLHLDDFRVFDGDLVRTFIVTTSIGAARLLERKAHPHLEVVLAGEGELVDLPCAMGILRKQFGIQYLLCEGGPTLYGYMSPRRFGGRKIYYRIAGRSRLGSSAGATTFSVRKGQSAKVPSNNLRGPRIYQGRRALVELAKLPPRRQSSIQPLQKNPVIG